MGLTAVWQRRFRNIGFLESVRARQLKLLNNTIAWMERRNSRLSLVGNATFFDARRFGWVETVEAGWGGVRQELDDVLKYAQAIPSFQDISVEQSAITSDDRWKTFFLYAYGIRNDTNCAVCPQTARLLQRIPGMRTAFFSILYPGKRIPEHRGPYNGVLRYHLGLKVPAAVSSCGIRVGSDVSGWQDGKSLVFDDTYVHSAWNLSDDIRVVLFVDFLRPLPFLQSRLNRAIIALIAATEFVQGGLRRQKTWDDKFTQVYETGDRRKG